MLIPVVSAIVISFVLYLAIGFYHNGRIKSLADILPLTKGNTEAHVKSASEFSATTTATTISLATVIIAFYELVPMLGWWLLWPAVTTSLGLLAFGVLAKRIWKKMSEYEHRPSMHEFLGVEFSSKQVALVGSVFTTLGYLSMFAVELTVGSRFIASLMHEIPEWLTVLSIAVVAFAYLSLGGFRTAIVTDRLMMWFIWLLLCSVFIYYLYSANAIGFERAMSNIPESHRGISWHPALLSFVCGIFIVNVLSFVANMGLWQRIAGSEKPETVVSGMWQSVLGTFVSWSLFAVICVGAYTVVTPVEGENLLVTFLKAIVTDPVGKVVIFCVTLGLLGAQLSTASTQLIAVSHTIYEDIIAPFRQKALSARLNSFGEVNISRIIIVISAVLAVAVVELLRVAGFGVADLALAIYGASLGLVPAVLVALFVPRNKLSRLKLAASISIAFGFAAGWGCAFYGKFVSDPNFVFWAPVASLFVSLGTLSSGYFISCLQNHPVE